MLLDRERLAMRWEDQTSAVSRGEKDSCTQEMIAMAAAGARANVADVRGRESCSMRVAELEQRLRTCLDANGVAMTVVSEDVPEDLHVWFSGRESPAAVARRLRL